MRNLQELLLVWGMWVCSKIRPLLLKCCWKGTLDSKFIMLEASIASQCHIDNTIGLIQNLIEKDIDPQVEQAFQECNPDYRIAIRVRFQNTIKNLDLIFDEAAREDRIIIQYFNKNIPSHMIMIHCINL